MNGMVEYWQPEAPFELPRSLKFEMKSETDLYEFRKVGQNDFWDYAIMYTHKDAYVFRTNRCQLQ